MSREKVVMDIECYRDYFLVSFSKLSASRFVGFEMYDGVELDRRAIIKLLKKYTIVTFNGRNYDIPILMYALTGRADNMDLKRASDHIIQGNLKPWEFEEQYGVTTHPCIDHIDLIEVAPGQASLKLYAGRIHAQLMQDLPYHHDDFIFPAVGEVIDELAKRTAEFHGATWSDGKRLVVYHYCGNDLSNTKALYYSREKEIHLREEMGALYGLDLRSKSDAQIAEAVIKKEIETMTGRRVYKPRGGQTSFRYEPPKFIKFKTRQMQQVLRVVCDSTFIMESGKVKIPQAVDKLAIRIGDSSYKMGNGGLHSMESCVAHHADEDNIIVGPDVRSYYPSIILECELYPEHLGKAFLTVFRRIYDTRLKAKDAGDRSTDKMLKIVLNGSFGKFGSQYSILFSAHLLIQTTVTGQLALLMLIEQLESQGMAVVSANTDGVVIKCPRHLERAMVGIIKAWERDTGFKMDTENYQSLYSRDVNNYIAIMEPDADGVVEVKRKGAYAPAGLQKNASTEICVDAVVALLKDGTPLEDTINWCTDIRKFVAIKTVAGGAEQHHGYEEVDDWVQVEERRWLRQAWIDQGLDKGGERRKSRPKPVVVGNAPKYLGKAIRWYYSINSPGPISYVKNGNRVPKSEGALALMNLPERPPTDIDHAWYLNESISILRDIAAFDHAEAYTL